uniref:RING-type domain-containing protein n=1 Tax=Glossina brevipalpis TaxID=37001 RepID=A0A1A9WM98_9MUSC
MGETLSSQSHHSESSNIVCSLCCQNLTKEDEIFAISCGHIFHSQCIQVWRLTYKNCPKCRKDTPELIKILPTFADNKSEEITINAFDEAKEKSFETKTETLKEGKPVESENNCNLLKEEDCTLENEIHEVKTSLPEFINDDDCFKEPSELRNSAEQLKKKINVLSELQAVTAEENKILNQKLNYVTMELEKQLSKCSRLSSENQRLQNLAQTIKQLTHNKGTAEQQSSKMQNNTILNICFEN